tara:strand:+ start:2181 stop:3473 length:1293 start_codon:yes stop_codon:yes gene_type:complete
MAMTRLTDFVTDLMKSEMKSGASITSKESAHHFMNRVIQEMCIKNPELKKGIMAHHDEIHGVLDNVIAIYFQDLAKYNDSDFYRMPIESRLKSIKNSADKLFDTAKNKNTFGILLGMTCKTIAAVIGIIVAIPATDNLYRDLRNCFSQIVVGLVRDAIALFVSITSDVAAILSGLMLAVSRVFVDKDNVDNYPFLREMNQLVVMRAGAYTKLWSDFSEMGLMIRLIYMHTPVDTLSIEDQFRFLDAYQRIEFSKDEFNLRENDLFLVLSDLLKYTGNTEKENVTKLLEGMEMQMRYIGLMEDECKEELILGLAFQYRSNDLYRPVLTQIQEVTFKLLSSMTNNEAVLDLAYRLDDIVKQSYSYKLRGSAANFSNELEQLIIRHTEIKPPQPKPTKGLNIPEKKIAKRPISRSPSPITKGLDNRLKRDRDS